MHSLSCGKYDIECCIDFAWRFRSIIVARSVFYSFHYQNDISRVMTVRNRWVTYGNQIASGVIDHADFEKVKRQGDFAIKRWIDNQLEGTSATIVLIGSDTLNRPYVKYEICKSLGRGNAIIGVYVNRLKNLAGDTSVACNPHTVIGYCDDGSPVYFDDIADGIYDYVNQDGYNNLNSWVERAVRRH